MVTLRAQLGGLPSPESRGYARESVTESVSSGTSALWRAQPRYSVGGTVLRADHDEQHLEPLHRFNGVRLIRRHQDHLPGAHPVGLTGDADFRFAFEHVHQSIEGRGVLA